MGRRAGRDGRIEARGDHVDRGDVADPGVDLDDLLLAGDPPDPATAIPVTVVTGFLGAGKTTLVNRLLAEEHGRRLGVIVNDFGALEVDAALIVGVEDGAVSLANGCVCCEIRGDLVAAVDSLTSSIGDLDGIVVEASGVAEPSGIARTFTSNPFRSAVRLDGIVAMVDGEQLPEQADDPATRDLVFGQIGYSDLVIVNKIDLADRARIDTVRRFVHDRLPSVRIIETTRADVPLAVLLGARSSDPVRSTGTSGSSVAGTDSAIEGGTASDRFVSWVHRGGEIDTERLTAAIVSLPRTVLRIKGFVRAPGGEPSVVNAVGRRVELTPPPPDVAERVGRSGGRAPLGTELVVIAERSVDRDGADAVLRTAAAPG